VSAAGGRDVREYTFKHEHCNCCVNVYELNGRVHEYGSGGVQRLWAW